MKRLLYYVLLWLKLKLVEIPALSELGCPEEIAPVLRVIRRPFCLYCLWWAKMVSLVSFRRFYGDTSSYFCHFCSCSSSYHILVLETTFSWSESQLHEGSSCQDILNGQLDVLYGHRTSVTLVSFYVV